MAEAHIARLMQCIALTFETEIDCGECAHLLAGYAEAVLAGQDGHVRWTLVQGHLAQCPICAEEFDSLCRVTKMEMDGNFPSIALLIDRLIRPELFL
ncbi:MAG: hypothetical protein WCF84_05315 [Anaerolineae bacterium]